MRPEMIEEAALLTRHWQVENPSDDLAARIVANATRLKQHTPLRLRLNAFLQSLFGGWNVALIPATAVAALLIVGAFSSQVRPLDEDLSVEALIVDGMISNDDL